jgi:flavin reductase (DIM6/NTAB) family NADH-FMN oxidoreductase RutF
MRRRPAGERIDNMTNTLGEIRLKKSLGARTMLYPTPVSVVGTYDKNGKPNIATAAWVGICCSKPPCVTVSFRKATYTHGNIGDRKAFTINIPPEKHVKETDYVGIASGREVDKFSIAKLTPVKSDLADAPYVKEFSLVLGCKLLHIIELGLHTQFIGEIMDIKADETTLENPRARVMMSFLRSFFIRQLVVIVHWKQILGIGPPTAQTAFARRLNLVRTGFSTEVEV